jgi:fucose permease
MDRLGFNPGPIVAGLGCAAICLLLFHIVPPSDFGWNMLLFGAGLGITGLTFMGSPLGAALYPPELRATALGSVIAVPRLAGILAPIAVGALIGWGLSSKAIVAALAAPVAIAAFLVIMLFRGAAKARHDAAGV